MTRDEITLRSVLPEHHNKELKPWNPEDPTKALAWLRKRCGALHKRLGPDLRLRFHAWRSHVAAPLLLDALGADFPEDYDPLLLIYIHGASNTLIEALRPALGPALAPLPEARRAKIHAAYTQQALDQALQATWRDAEGAARWLEGAEGIEEALKARRTALRAEKYGRSHEARALLLIHRGIYGDAPPPRSLDPIFKLWIQGERRFVRGNSVVENTRDLLRWWPDEALETLLLSMKTDPPWELFAQVHTPRTRAAAISRALKHESPRWRGAQLEDTLVAFGPEIRPELVAALKKSNDGHRAIIAGALARLSDASHAPELIDLLAHTGPHTPLIAAEALLAMGEEVAQTLREAMGKGQRRDRWIRWILGRLDGERTAATPAEAIEAIEHHTAHHDTSDATIRGLREMIQNGFNRQWRTEMAKGLRFLGLILSPRGEHLFQGQEGSRMWLMALRFNHLDDRAIAAGLMALDLNTFSVAGEEGDEAYLDNLHDIFGAPFIDHVLHHMPLRRATTRAVLYNWLCARGMGGAELHLDMLKDTSELVRETASKALLSLEGIELPHPDVLIQLGSAKGHERAGATLYLRLSGRSEALAPLKAALAKERSKKIKNLIKDAIAACDPFIKDLADRARPFGAYQRMEALDASVGLSQLRALVYETPTLPVWVRLCDLLQRFYDEGSLTVALDYLHSHKIDQWPREIRIRPWGWEKIGPLAEIAPEPHSPWVPVSTFMSGQGDPFLDARLKAQESGLRARLFVREDAHLFALWVGRAWAWCEAQGIGPEHLEVRVDGGAVHRSHMMRAESTMLSLWQGFGAVVERTTARRQGEGEPHGLRMVRVKVPGKHPLREELEMGRRKKFLDLIPLLEG